MSQTEGSLQSFGFDNKTDLRKIREITNVCPQFDILWPELTITDHLKLIHEIKGIKPSLMSESLDKLISAVNLQKSKNDMIKNLSGGMKRRVSIAIATIGSPNVRKRKIYKKEF